MAEAPVIDAIGRALKGARSIVLTTHITPDGDGLGAATGLLRFLRRIGKSARIVNCSSMPADLRWLVREGEFQVWSPARHADLVRRADVVVATDLGNASRLGRMEVPVRRSLGTKVVIDHHIFENDLFDLSLIDVEASSSSELACRLVQSMGGEIDHDLAEPFYVGLVSDTGKFSYSGTSPEAHRLAADFLEAGVEPQEVWRRLECQVPIEKLRFLGARLQDLRLEAGGRVVWTAITQAELAARNVQARDAFEVVNHLLSLKGVEVGLLFLEVGEELTKVSLRSAGTVDVCAIARLFGGGGHRFAAGCTVSGPPLGDAVRRLVEEAAARLGGEAQA